MAQQAFDFGSYVKRYLGSPGRNDADRLGVRVSQGADVECIGVHVLTGDENWGKRNVYLAVLDANGERIPNAVVEWMWEGREEPPLRVVLDKPENEPPGNIALEADMTVSCWLPDCNSARVSGLHTRHTDEPPGNTYGHWSYFVVFRMRGSGVPMPVPPIEEPIQPGDWAWLGPQVQAAYTDMENAQNKLITVIEWLQDKT